MRFSQKVKEELGYYVYALVDPRDNKIFYIGKGLGDRVFQHAEAALSENDKSYKLDTIREIIKEGKQVAYYILRHKLTEDTALIVESTLIDMLTYKSFNKKNQLTNIVAGHHQWDEGIKSVEELNAIYDCKKIKLESVGTLLLVNLNRSFDQAKSTGVYRRVNIYEATRKYWAISSHRAGCIKYVLGVYRGIVRCVIEVESYHWVEIAEDGTPFKKPRCCFEGKMIDDSPYINTDVTDFPFGSGGAIRYI